MCGIAGFCDFSKKSNKQTLINMTDVLHHRGPDDSGYSFYENEFANIGLGHRRLSILDLSAHGHQPMEHAHLEIVFNGEVYNFAEISKELESFGYIFESHSDTEVILKAYHRWGIKAVDKFIGMFAIVIYDKKNQKLIFIRDRAGVKPLNYYFKDGLFMFSSELKSFHEHPDFEKNLSLDGVKLFFQYGYIREPYTIFEHTHKLPAGHYAELNIINTKFEIYKYWDVIDSYNKPKLNISFEEAKEETQRLLKSACEYRMVSDVPVGIFLSGGYDSSAVTAILQKNRTEKLKTFSIGFHEEKYNEAHYAKKVANHLGTDHTEYYCTQKDAQEILPLLSEIWDEPFADNSVIPTVLVSKLAKKDVKVSLSADGGDEIFGGYDKYTKIIRYKNYLNKIPLKNNLNNILSRINPKYIPILNKINNFEVKYQKGINLLNSNNELDILNTIVQFYNSNEINKILNISHKDLSLSLKNYPNILDKNEVLDKIMMIDYKTYQLDDILVKVDRATMNAGLEGREPFLDHRIIEFVSTLPNNYKIKDGNKKYILKAITHDYIPKEIMERPKMGFSIPLNEWFGDELKTYVIDYLDNIKLEKVGIFNVKEVVKLKQEWLEKGFHSSKLWIILIFMMWYTKWMNK
ncbi:asparagine synthase (glutamine-hydrolyzing) [Aliarcobacter cryaerophilus]|uniref:asparagine synthase (glutamine-hydrolyzing) n=1 Tax=Aliarcobacter cryaerophilus TaxID=28198 RepID=UPI003DA4D4A5